MLMLWNGILHRDNTYLGAGTTGGNTGTPTIFSATSPVDGGAAYYSLTIDAVTANTYTLKATPINNQVGDGVLVISQTGERGWDRNNDGDLVDTNEDRWD